MTSPVMVINTGTANLASIRAAFTRLGAESVITDDAEAIRDAERLVLPGVGAFASGMSRLCSIGVADALRQRVERGRPLLAVCLGLQLLCRSSEESPGVEGLGVIDAGVERFRDATVVPQLGWNGVEPVGCRLVLPGFAYYANSYRLAAAPAGWGAAFTEHGERFVAALERGPILACQFHPELSGAWGHALLRRWLEASAATEVGSEHTSEPARGATC